MSSRLDEIKRKKSLLEPDAEEHIDYLLTELERKDKALREIAAHGSSSTFEIASEAIAEVPDAR